MVLVKRSLAEALLRLEFKVSKKIIVFEMGRSLLEDVVPLWIKRSLSVTKELELDFINKDRVANKLVKEVLINLLLALQTL